MRRDGDLPATDESFAWHPGAEVFGRGFRLDGVATDAGPHSPAHPPPSAEVEFIAAGSGRNPPETYLRMFAAIRRGAEFCVTGERPKSAAAPSANADSGIQRPSENKREESEPGRLFQCETSGSTGVPRRIRRTHSSWIRSFRENARMLEFGASDEFAILGRLAHSLSLYGALEALFLGARLHDLSGLRPGAQLSGLSDSRATVLYATPTQLRVLLDPLDQGRARPVSSMRKVMVGGSKLDPGLRAGCAGLFPGAELHEFYGTAETSFVAIGTGETPPESVGKAYPGVEIRIKRSAAAPADAPGEIQVRSPYVFIDYAESHSGSANRDGDWIATGETGWLDSEGNLFLAGRTDRMVQIADVNVHPERTELFLLAQEGVAEAAAIPVPDTKRGHCLMAFVRLRGDRRSRERLERACRAELGAPEAPRRIIPLSNWPLLPSGKTDYEALRAILRSRTK